MFQICSKKTIPIQFSAGIFVIAIGISVGLIAVPASFAEENVHLRFRHFEGDVLHAEARVDEVVYINGIASHRAVIEETSVSRVMSVDQDGGAVVNATFRTEERIAGLPWANEWISAETVRLERDVLGQMTVPPDAARPVLRSMPLFPEDVVSPGARWTADAAEVHVFRIGDELAGPYRGEVLVSYEYAGDVVDDGRTLARILIDYDLYLPIRGRSEPVRLVSGQSSQELYWDIDAGRPKSKIEDFEFLMMMSDGTVQEFRGSQEVDYRVTGALDRGRAAENLRFRLSEMPGVSVSADEDGVRVVLEAGEAILFGPESSDVTPDQIRRLAGLREAMADYGDRDILITGHTADFGTEEGRRRLSLDRAAAVAEILFPEVRKGNGRLYLRGAGSEEPRSNEQTPAGKALNRRVEILILD
ncbi:MAG: OmpA family protein [Spirochaetaceae bacterium]|nr:OmpA family protein [Spirochaetaceae bacterium]MDT8296818.1 OmpA family protein [Spirochaetaceae bacterium]